MRLSPGTRLGVYEIIGALGAGGMGEVYRARDTKLGRDVALKTLPDVFAAEPDRLMRFEREARTLASLNHPSIAQLYGIEDATAIRALVMELVEGEDLTARIARGPIPPEDALPIARQIADALEAAHEHGIIHRDLKPGNVKVRPDGTVKVLDFGLAKAMEHGGRQGAGRVGGQESAVGRTLANSPTVTSPAMTMRGVILGTAAYMAPEQAKGRAVDQRADVWAFGCVLYEMLAGRKVFDAEDETDTLTAILRDAPDWAALPPSTPQPIRTLLRRCLEKDPRKRAAHMSIARLEIDEALTAPAADAPSQIDIPRVAHRTHWRELVGWSLAAASAVFALWAGLRSDVPRESYAAVGRFALDIPWTHERGNIGLVALSPDGSSIAVQSNTTAAELAPIYVRRLDASAFTMVPGGERVRARAWSADGGSLLGLTRVDFAAGTRTDEVLRIDVASGQTRSIARLPPGLVPFIAAEGARGVVLIGVAGQPLHVVARPGDTPTPLGTLDTAVREIEQQSPVFFPDGRRFFYTSVREGNQLTPRLRSLDSNEVRDLEGVDGRIIWADDRYVIVRRDAALFAQAFSIDPLAPKGRPVLLADDAPLLSFLPRQAIAGATGSLLAYRTGALVSQQFTWFGRDGKRLGTIGPEGTFYTFDLSRDGSRLVVSRTEAVGMNLWVLDTAKGSFNRVTTGTASDLDPRASGDGRMVIFASTRDAARSPFRGSLVVQEPSDRVFQFAGQTYCNDDWSADGRWLLYHDASVPVLHATRVDRTGDPPVVVARALTGIIDQARMSHDGRWVAYNSSESGRSEVYVVPFPPTGDRWQLSVGGGVQPLWRRDGRELYYLGLDGTLMAVAIEASTTFNVGKAARLFQSPLRALAGDTEQYAVAPDGSRFLFAPFIEAAKPDGVRVVTNWMSLLPQPRD